MVDPFAFLKPDKMISMEGLLSRDMLENFDDDDLDILDDLSDLEEDNYFNDDFSSEYDVIPDQLEDDLKKPDECCQYRLDYLAGLLADRVQCIADSLNLGYIVGIGILPTVYSLVRFDSSGTQETLYDVDIDDGPPLTEREIRMLATLLEQNIYSWLTGFVATDMHEVNDGSGQVNLFVISVKLPFEL